MDLSIPEFRSDGYLPNGLHQATEAEVTFRFGTASKRRKRLALRLRRWIELGRLVGAERILIDGSFVTAKLEPNDLDAVMRIPPNLQEQVDRGNEAAIELADALLTRTPEELFAAEDTEDWHAWVDFFSQTREADGRCKGLVEIVL